MKIGVPKEIMPGERRVALVPDAVSGLVKAKNEVLVETGAGAAAYFTDADYQKAGARIIPDAAALYGDADIVVKIHKPVENTALGKHEVDLMREGAVLITFLQPAMNPDLVQRLIARKISGFSLDALPRITRAQAMDALSSQATVAGYKAVLIAAGAIGKFFPMLTTAAGTIAPARVFVLGAGVAGLQAIATARRLGAVVFAYDVRPAVKEQVESLGAKFLMVELADKDTQDKGGYAKELSEESHKREMEFLARNITGMDVVIATAAIPGKRAPLLITRAMVAAMKPGSVIVDLAAETGGNCELTQAGREVVANGVTIFGPVNLPSAMPTHASQMFSKNITNLVMLMVAKDGKLALNFNDEIIKGTCVTHEGRSMRG